MGVSRYNIVNNADLRMGPKKQEAYLQTQMGTISGTIHDFDKKKGSAELGQSPNFIGARGENWTRTATKDRGILSPLRLPIPPPGHIDIFVPLLIPEFRSDFKQKR